MMTKEELLDSISVEAGKGLTALHELCKKSEWKPWDFWVEAYTALAVYSGQALAEINLHAIMGREIGDGKLVFLMDLTKQVELVLRSLNQESN